MAPWRRRLVSISQNAPSPQKVSPSLLLGFTRNIVLLAALTRTHNHWGHLRQSSSENGQRCSIKTVKTCFCSPTSPQRYVACVKRHVKNWRCWSGTRFATHSITLISSFWRSLISSSWHSWRRKDCRKLKILLGWLAISLTPSLPGSGRKEPLTCPAGGKL